MKERAWLIPRLAETFSRYSQAELTRKLKAIGLNPSGGLLETRIGRKNIHVRASAVSLRCRKPFFRRG